VSRTVSTHSRSQVSQPTDIPQRENTPLTGQRSGQPEIRRYGSIIGTPPRDQDDIVTSERGGKPPTLSLPEPVMDLDRTTPSTSGLQPQRSEQIKDRHSPLDLPPPASTGNAFEVGKTRTPGASLPHRYRSVFTPKRVNSMPGGGSSRPIYERFLSFSGKSSPAHADVPLEAYREVDVRQAQFYNFLDLELDKIETFYKAKEDEATDRLKVLREQLHIMRDRRLDELIASRAAKLRPKSKDAAQQALLHQHDGNNSDHSKPKDGFAKRVAFRLSVDKTVDAAKSAGRKLSRSKPSGKSMEQLGTPTALRPRNLDGQRDYTRRPEPYKIPYSSAKRKLKVALQEYYRGLELLKSYALLNRTAFRKINKKYDKTVNARPSYRYMTEKVNKAWFVQSDVIDGHIRAVEDLYARYFEQGNHKVAVGKLRVKSSRIGDYSAPAFYNGLMAAVGAVFGVQGIVHAGKLLYSGNSVLETQTSYLLQVNSESVQPEEFKLTSAQIYAGYFLMLLLMVLFCFDCRLWARSKINYVFVFEFDTRHHLDWRQLCEVNSVI
jgi:xenotropic and polytropic retrovirus receptor 1